MFHRFPSGLLSRRYRHPALSVRLPAMYSLLQRFCLSRVSHRGRIVKQRRPVICNTVTLPLLFIGRGNTAVDSFSHIEKPLFNTRQNALIRIKMGIYIAEPYEGGRVPLKTLPKSSAEDPAEFFPAKIHGTFRPVPCPVKSTVTLQPGLRIYCTGRAKAYPVSISTTFRSGSPFRKRSRFSAKMPQICSSVSGRE